VRQSAIVPWLLSARHASVADGRKVSAVLELDQLVISGVAHGCPVALQKAESAKEKRGGGMG